MARLWLRRLPLVPGGIQSDSGVADSPFEGGVMGRWGYGGLVAGETDAGGVRRRALDEFLAERVAAGFHVEVHEHTHAIVVQGGNSLVSRLLGRRRRFVVEVDDHGIASMRPAEPVRH